MTPRQAPLFAIALASLAIAASPTVGKVEPPDWPASAKPITLRLLVTGANLTGAAVHAPFPSGAVKASASGTHLFFDLTVPANAKPGDYAIDIRTADGAVRAPFHIVAPLPTAGRFQGFTPNDVIYLIMPDRFANGDPSNDDPAISAGLYDRAKPRSYHGGDFAGIAAHLPYLKDLGVTALWLTPIYDNANHTRTPGGGTDYHGYGAVDFYGVDEHLGTLDEFRSLVDKAHAAGIKIIQDEVANHTGPFHPWAQDPPTPTWFHGTPAAHVTDDFRIWTIMDPHATAETSHKTLDGWFANSLPDLNQSDPEVARYLIQNSLWWIARTGIDGIREDTLPYAPRAFWRDWSAAIHRAYPKFNLVGEVFDSDPSEVSYFQGGRKQSDGIDTGVDTLFDFPLQSAVTRVFNGTGDLVELARIFSHDWLYPDPTRLVTFLGLHDQQRFVNLKGASPDSLIQTFAFLFTTRGIPMIYYGDEIALPGGNDPDNRRDFPGGWPNDPRNAFEESGRTPTQQQVFAAVRKLARLRAESEALRTGKQTDLYVEAATYAFARSAASDRVIVIFNNGAREFTGRIPLTGSGLVDGATLTDRFGSAPAITARDGAIEVRLAPKSVAIYQ